MNTHIALFFEGFYSHARHHSSGGMRREGVPKNTKVVQKNTNNCVFQRGVCMPCNVQLQMMSEWILFVIKERISMSINEYSKPD